MADDPQDRELTFTDRGRPATEEMDGDVGTARPGAFPVIAKANTGRVAATLEGTLEGTRKVVVTPRLGDLPVRGADQEIDPRVRRPGNQGVANLDGSIAKRALLSPSVARGQHVDRSLSLDGRAAEALRVRGRWHEPGNMDAAGVDELLRSLA